MGEKTTAQRRRRADDTRRWRARQKRGAAVYPVEVDGRIFDLMARNSHGGRRGSPAAIFPATLHRSLATSRLATDWSHAQLVRRDNRFRARLLRALNSGAT